MQATGTIQILSLGSDTYLWSNPYGGVWGSAPNWTDTTAGSVASVAPGTGNAVTITGGTNDNFTSLIGAGTAGRVAIANDVLLWGAITTTGMVTLSASADLDLDGGANLSGGSLNLSNAASLEVGGASTLTIAGSAALTAGFLAAIDGSTVRLGGLVANALNQGYPVVADTIAVDDNASIEVGSTGGAAAGAITIDAGLTTAVTGTIDGNLIVNGILAVSARAALAIDTSDPFGTAQGISGSGTVVISENSLLTLGVADSATIGFAGPAGTLVLSALPGGTIAGFAAGDIIEITGGGTAVATGLTYTQPGATLARLTLTKGGHSVGTLTLSGNYAGSLFHLGVDTGGDSFITLQTVGTAPVQPSVIIGTAGYDVLTATANNQTLTGLGGNDSLSAATFSGIDFKDTSADLTGSTILSFAASDIIDLTDIRPATASVTYAPGTTGQPALIVTDGTRTATIGIGFNNGLQPGFFTTAGDNGTGTDVTFLAANTDADTFAASPGGNYTTASKWQDITTGTVAALPPSYGNTATIAAGTAGFTDVTGNGFAASLTASGDVLVWGSLNVGSKLAGVSGNLTQTGTLALDGGAALVLAGSASVGGLVEIGAGSTMTASGGLIFARTGASLLATGGGSGQFASVLTPGGAASASVIGVDTTSSIAVGTGGTAAVGALTIETGTTATLAGTIDGNTVVNGTLAVAGTLAIAPFGANTPAISGTGTIALTYGDTLSLAGSDSAAILFSQSGAGGGAGNTETLALASSLPAGMIAGFAPGDVISVGIVVTNLTYTQIGGVGRLSLLDGATTVGVLIFSGTYVAGQFQVQLAPGGVSSVITYAPNPGTAAGNSVSGNSDSDSWTSSTGGVWSNAGNWTDTTTGTPAGAAPGASDAVTINDNTGAWTPQIIYGPGAAASLTISGAADTILMWTIAVSGQFSVGTYGTPSGDVALYSGANVSAGSLNVTSLLRVATASLLTVVGSGTGTFISGALTVGSDSVVRVAGGTSVITGIVAVDATSNAEFGNAGTATAGTLTIDYGQAVTLQGTATIAANLVINGGLLVYAGTIQGFGGSAGTIGGTGTITIGALGTAGTLILNASDTATIDFQGYSANGAPYAFESLELKNLLRTGAIIGFIAGDSIIVDQNVTGATFSQTTSTQGVLTLTDGATAVGTLTLKGNYAASLFQVDMAPETGVATVSLETATTAAGIALATLGGDAYAWVGASGGNWANAANWQDTTAGTTTIAMPGIATAVTIAGNITAGQYTTIGGIGVAADLTITGNVLLTGQVAVVGSVHVSSGSGPAAALTLESGAKLTSGGSAEVFGRLEVGGGSSIAFPGYALLYGGALLALHGSSVQAGGLIGDSAGDVLAVDANSTLSIGISLLPAAGALTVAAGAPAEFNGLIYGNIVVNGLLWVSGGGTLFIDMNATARADPYALAVPSISGTGLLLLTEGSTLGLGVADSAAIQFVGPNATLDLVAIPTAAIIGFASGDQIQVDQTVTGLTYRQVAAGSATLTLTNGTTTVGVLNLAGAYGGGVNAFHLDVAPNGDTAVITLQSLQTTPPQMTLIEGTVGADQLTATANGQTIMGLGGGDILSGGTCAAVDFRDYTAYLNGSAVQDFAPSDMLDFIDMAPLTAAVSYTNGIMSVTDGIHAASLNLTFASTPTSGSFHVASDGALGTMVTWS
jgi:filamentous hemagglutinin